MKLELVTTIVRNSDRSLALWTRPGTTDEKVIPEVLRRCVYEKPRIGFFLESTDKWLDLGGNIGTFVLLCQVRGVVSVVSFEPEPENFRMLTRNVQKNFPRATNILLVPHAVSVQKGTLPLYLCKVSNC